MSELTTHDWPDLEVIVPDGQYCFQHPDTPGAPVRLRSDYCSFGVIISRRWGPDDKPMQCEVLWSRPPVKTVSSAPRGLDRNSRDQRVMYDVLYRDVSLQDAMEADPDILDIRVTHDVAGRSEVSITRRSGSRRDDLVFEWNDADGQCSPRRCR